MTRTLRVGAADLAELMFAGFVPYECREVVEAASGYKLSRLLISRRKAELLAGWAAGRGLGFAVGCFDVLESLVPEGKGSWINEGRRAAAGAGLCFVYLGRSAVDLALATEADAAGEDAELLGHLFRIPDCCTRFYLDRMAESRRQHDNDYAPLVHRATTTPGPYPWQNNYLGQYFGHSLIHHYPCSWDCPATIRRAEEALALVAEVSEVWADHTRAMLTGTMVHAGRAGVHMVRGFTGRQGESYRADQVVSTTYDELSARIKRAAEQPSRSGQRVGWLDEGLLCIGFA